MNILTSLLGAFGSKKALTDDFSGGWLPAIGGGDGVNSRNLLEANKEWVYISVNKLATSVASVRFKVMRYERSGDDQEVFDGSLVEFLEKPSASFTGKDFIYLNTVYKELTGNAFWERVKGTGLVPLIPTQVYPVITGGKLTGFKYLDGGNQRQLKLEDVLHDRYVDPAKPFWGVGKLQKIARWVDISTTASDLLNRFFKNGAVFGGFIETEEETEQRIKLIKAGLQNDHVGVANFFKWGVLPKGSKATRSTTSMAELEMGATDDRYRDKILATFGLPKTLVGLTTEVNRASAEASEYIFAKYTVKPIVDDFIEFLNVNVAPTLDKTGKFYFAYDEFVPENLELRLREREIALNKQPYMTVNEVRATVGLPPVKDGDEIAKPVAAPFGAPSAAPEPSEAPKEEEDKQPKKAMPARARRSFKVEGLVDTIVTKALEVSTTEQSTDEARHKEFAGRVENHEKFVADAVRAFNNQQERELMLNLNRITKAVKKSDLFDMDAEVGVLVDFVTPLLKALMIEQALEEFAGEEFSGSLDTASPRFAATVAKAATRLSKSYNRTTANLVVDALNEGIEKGEALADLSARVRQIYDFSDSVRALQVARTEAFYVANEGSKEAYKQSGVVESMRWYTAAGDACEFCGPMEGKIVGTSEVFFPKGAQITGSQGGVMSADYRTIDVPPLHPNCRCFIRPERIDIG